MTEEQRRWPLIEVVAEIHLSSDAWCESIPDRLFERLQDQLPTRKKIKAVTAQFKIGPGKPEHVAEERDRHQFFAADGTRLVQIDSQVLTVNHLSPYTSWDDYSPLIARCLQDFLSVCPNAIFAGLGLQFINRIELCGLPLDIDDYLTFRPQFDGEFINCGCMVMQPWVEEASVVYRQMQTQPLEADCLPVTLILNARRNQPHVDDVVRWMDRAHIKLNQVFKASITERTKALFELPQEA